MKKILATVLFLFAALTMSAKASFAATTATNWDSAAALNRVNTIGNKILTSNGLPKGIVFKVALEDHVNAYANIDKEVYVYKGLLEFVENDQELAAVLSHEIGHIINAHCAKQGIINYGADIATSIKPVADSKYSKTIETGKQLALLKVSRDDEYEADLTGAELMIKAGYDPKAMISVLNKICENSFDIVSTHPSGINRLMNIYDYLNYSYPNTVKVAYNTSSYQNAFAAINSNVTTRNSKKNGQANHEKKMKKLQEKRIKAQSKNTRTSDPWSKSVTVINTLNAVNSMTK